MIKKEVLDSKRDQVESKIKYIQKVVKSLNAFWKLIWEI